MTNTLELSNRIKAGQERDCTGAQFISKKRHPMPNNLTFLAACSCANSATRQPSDEISLSSAHPERLERGYNANPNIDYDPLRLMRRSDAKQAPPKRFFRTFWRAVARRLLERQDA